MSWLISFEMWGEKFHPSQVSFQFTTQHDPGVIGTRGKYRGRPVPYGSASYVVPKSIPRSEGIKHLVMIVEPILNAIEVAGATEWNVHIVRRYADQCNEEFSREELALITRLRCGFTYAAYEEQK